jgi:hypothetical protein
VRVTVPGDAAVPHPGLGAAATWGVVVTVVPADVVAVVDDDVDELLQAANRSGTTVNAVATASTDREDRESRSVFNPRPSTFDHPPYRSLRLRRDSPPETSRRT